ncbi:MAG: GYD domain-containing protein [Steroidobacteraceae bacterium]
MPIYLWSASYTAEGAKGLIKEGGSKRRAAVQQMAEKAGGKLHAFYYAFGDADVVGIVEFPDAVTAAAASLAVNSTGAVSLRSTMLFTPEDMDAAAKKTLAYRPPGG